jgi:hypothetical protein
MYLDDVQQPKTNNDSTFGLNIKNGSETQKLITDKVRLDIERLKERKDELEKISM